MLHRACVISLALAFSLNVNARGIYKCVSAAGTAYQSARCESGSAEEILSDALPDSLVQPPRDTDGDSALVAVNQGGDSRASSAGSVAPRSFGGSSLSGVENPSLGITDDQALNMPGWGPPKKIVRTRERSGWRELWTYARKSGGAPQLEFLNGRLVAVSVRPEPAETERIISLSAR